MKEKIAICLPGLAVDDVTFEEKKDTETLLSVMKNIYTELFYSQFEIRSGVHREPGYSSRFPAIHPDRVATYFPKGLDECIQYLINRFGKEKEVRQHLETISI